MEHRLPRHLREGVVSILGTVAIAGFLPGVAVGVLLAVLIFIVSYSRQGAVRHEFTEAAYRSKVTGIDSSTVQAFQRIDRLARTGGLVLVWSG